MSHLDQPGIDQEPVEAARFGAPGAAVERAVATIEDPLLLGERAVERQARGFQHDQRKIGGIEPVQGRSEDRPAEVDGVDGVIGRVVARIVFHEPLASAASASAGSRVLAAKLRLMVAEPDDQERLAGNSRASRASEVRYSRAHSWSAAGYTRRPPAGCRVAPDRGQIRAKARVPRKVVGHRIDEKEQRSACRARVSISRDGLVVIETGRARRRRHPSRLRVDQALDARAGLKLARAEKGPIGRIKAERVL